MKITGAEFKEWHETAWPDGWIWADDFMLPGDREIYTGDNKIALDDAEVLTIPADWQIEKEGVSLRDREFKSIRSLITKWRQDRAFVIYVIQVPKAEADAAAVLLRERKWLEDGKEQAP